MKMTAGEARGLVVAIIVVGVVGVAAIWSNWAFSSDDESTEMNESPRYGAECVSESGVELSDSTGMAASDSGEVKKKRGENRLRSVPMRRYRSFLDEPVEDFDER